MSILEDILSKELNTEPIQKPVLHPIPGDNNQEPVSEVTQTSVPQSQIAGLSTPTLKKPVSQPIPQPQPETPLQNKWGYTQDEMNALNKVGFPPERIDEYLSDFDPSKHNILTKLYEMSIPKPEVPDEKKIRNAKAISAIGDSLGLLGQMWSSGRGAHIRNRDYDQSASAQTNKEEEKQRNLYLNLSNNYNQGLYNARLKDFIQGLNEYNTGRKDIRDAITNKQELDFKNQQETQKQLNWQADYDYKKTHDDAVQTGKDADRTQKEAELIERTRHEKAMEGIGLTNAKTNKSRADYYTSGGGKPNKIVPLYFKDGQKIEIPEEIWNANWQEVALDLINNPEVRKKYPLVAKWKVEIPTQSQVEFFLKQNKDDLPKESRDFLRGISQGEGAVYGEEVQPNPGLNYITNQNKSTQKPPISTLTPQNPNSKKIGW